MERKASKETVPESSLSPTDAARESATLPKLSVPCQPLVVTDDESGLRLDRFLKKRGGTAAVHGALHKWLRTGQVRVDGRRAEAGDRLEVGQSVRVPPAFSASRDERDAEAPRTFTEAARRRARAMVLYEDPLVMVLNKPPGLAAQGGTGIRTSVDTWLDALVPEGAESPRLTHRLDRATSGALIVALTAKAAAHLAASFRDRRVRKLYWGVTVGVPTHAEGRITRPLVRRGEHVVEDAESPNAKEAVTLYRVVDTLGDRLAFVALCPLTGRTHQLRAHMALEGTPLVGDPLYGKAEAQVGGIGRCALGAGLHLHARRLRIPHPSGDGFVDVTAPLFPAMQATFKACGFTHGPEADTWVEEPSANPRTMGPRKARGR